MSKVMIPKKKKEKEKVDVKVEVEIKLKLMYVLLFLILYFSYSIIVTHYSKISKDGRLATQGQWINEYKDQISAASQIKNQ